MGRRCGGVAVTTCDAAAAAAWAAGQRGWRARWACCAPVPSLALSPRPDVAARGLTAAPAPALVQCGLSTRILEVLKKGGFEQPLSIQAQALPGAWLGCRGRCSLAAAPWPACSRAPGLGLPAWHGSCHHPSPALPCRVSPRALCPPACLPARPPARSHHERPRLHRHRQDRQRQDAGVCAAHDAPRQGPAGAGQRGRARGSGHGSHTGAGDAGERAGVVVAYGGVCWSCSGAARVCGWPPAAARWLLCAVRCVLSRRHLPPLPPPAVLAPAARHPPPPRTRSLLGTRRRLARRSSGLPRWWG